LKNADNITATFVSPATAASSVGTFAIVPALVDPTTKLGNYAVASNNGVLTVTQAALTVSAGNATRIYGDANRPLWDDHGLKNGDNITATVSGAGADPTSPVGSYVLVPALVDPTGKAGNYAVTLNNGTLTITPAALSISANNATRLYGDANRIYRDVHRIAQCG